CTRLVRQDAISHFIHNFESGLRCWVVLLIETTPRHHIPSTDGGFVAAFRTLDRVITTENSTGLLSRLAYVQLTHVLELLEARVAEERRKGHLHRRRDYPNASVVLDIYMSAQDRGVSPISRHTLIERRRTARRWSELAGPWPLLLLIYSEDADEVV
ncbi:hypothetical protein LZ30DRAFT_534958, partial [Colletotrichum cereale]